MSAHVARLSRLFTPEYVKRVNAQIVYPAQSALVKPNELESALSRPLHLSLDEPSKDAAYFAATLSYGIITAKPFKSGNQGTAFFVANEYVRAMGIPGLADSGKVGSAYKGVADIAQRHIDIDAAAGKPAANDLAGRSDGS